MKLALISLLLTGCQNYTTTFGLAYESEGKRIEGTATFEPVSGKQPVKVQK